MIIVFQLFILILLLGFIALLIYSMLFGGPYAPIGQQRTKSMLSLLNIKPGEKAVDLGAGDGRTVIAMAKKGAVAHGYEINPLLVWIARRKIKKEKLEKKAFMHMTDMWRKNYSSFDVITVYLAPHIMGKLEKKLKKELKKNGRIAMNHYHFPNWKPKQIKNNIYLYTNR